MWILVANPQLWCCLCVFIGVGLEFVKGGDAFPFCADNADYSPMSESDFSGNVSQLRASVFVEPYSERDFATCVLFGLHVRTFDGLFYTNPSRCSFTAAKAIDNSFRVIVDNLNCAQDNCQRVVTVRLGTGISAMEFQTDEQQIQLTTMSSGAVETYEVNDTAFSLALSSHGRVKKTGDYIELEIGAGDARVKIDDGSVMITVDKEGGFYGESMMQGLCGNYDEDISNDFRDPSGVHVAFSPSFAASWHYSEEGVSCSETPSTQHPCETLDDVTRGAAWAACSQIKQGPFQPCNSEFGVEEYFLACLFDYCDAVSGGGSGGVHSNDTCDALCSTFSMWTHICQQKKPSVGNIQWRTDEFCPKSCPDPNMEYTECGPSCVHSCRFSSRALDAACFSECVPGCFCKEGFYLSERSGECVRKEECPCDYNGVDYTTGQIVQLADGCNQCTCEGGQWECSHHKCEGVCEVTGHGLYTTFDGLNYLYPGNCEYILAQATNSGDNSQRDFIIKIGHYDCHEGGVFGCKKHLTAIIKGENGVQQTVHIGQQSLIQINGNRVTEAELPFAAGSVTVARLTSVFWAISGNGVKVLFDGVARVYVTVLPDYYEGKVMGLCGLFDYNPSNDLKTRLNTVEADVSAFAASWVTSSSFESSCTPITSFDLSTCNTNEQRQSAAVKHCSVMTDGAAFEPCRRVLDPEPYIKQCKYDVCSCGLSDQSDVTACSAMAAYAHECRKYLNESQTVDAVSGWRVETGSKGFFDCSAGVTDICTGSMSYSECMHITSGTCQQQSKLTLLDHEGLDRYCLAGCACPQGQLFDEDSQTCIEESQCPCFFGGETVSEGESYESGCLTCYCSSGGWACDVETMCNKSCSGNMVFEENKQPCLPTCESHWLGESPETNCPLSAVPGLCTCPEGKVLMDSTSSTCVDPGTCPCYHAGREYAFGETISQDCNRCTCDGRVWNCTEMNCHATCYAVGDMHYKTFDDKKYTFNGQCNYVLAEHESKHFGVEIKNQACGSSNTACTHEVFIYFEGGNHTVSLLRGRGIEINGVAVSKYETGYFYEPSIGLRVDEPGFFVVVKVDRPEAKFSVAWDGVMSTYVRVGGEHEGEIGGLCGNLNTNSQDDWTSADRILQSAVSPFANSWKTDPVCPDHTETSKDPSNSDRYGWAMHQCSKIKETPLFKDCHSVLAPEPFFDSCVEDATYCDLGGDCECMCTGVARYARECCQEFGICVPWRSEHFCPAGCGICREEDIFIKYDQLEYPLNSTCKEYRVCGPACPLTCQNYHEQRQQPCDDDRCYEGCFCKAGYVWEPYSQSCVLPGECPCTIRDKKGEMTFVGQGYTYWKNNCRRCVCEGTGRFVCELDRENPECHCDSVFEHACDVSGRVQCISKLSVCDGIQDCDDNSDEEGCDCSTFDYSCDGSGEFCYDESDKCDGECDCLSRESYCLDEADCPGQCNLQTQFTCPSTNICIPKSFVCDGEIDCLETPKGAVLGVSLTTGVNSTSEMANDETGCNVCAPDEFMCSGDNYVPKYTGLCIPLDKVCDGHDDCGDGSDEPPFKTVESDLYERCAPPNGTVPTSTLTFSNGWKGKTYPYTTWPIYWEIRQAHPRLPDETEN
ncbi:mucin-6-like [Convolutriloba macropyga]|uniref:mucin-6-like n=1 Tax=Convolutriloba macropyga TaxID=536237 RepID=UPI003F521DD8